MGSQKSNRQKGVSFEIPSVLVRCDTQHARDCMQKSGSGMSALSTRL